MPRKPNLPPPAQAGLNVATLVATGHAASTQIRESASPESIAPNQRLFKATGKNTQALLDQLKRPARSNAGLKDLFSRKAPWDQQTTAQPSPALTSIQDAVGMLANRDDMVDPEAYVRKLRAPRF
jgi:hypothetical protein